MSGAHQRTALLLDATNLDMNSEIGDAHRGAGETFGKITFERSADDYFYSDLILIWGSNPIATQIPNSHFLTEARYHGAQLVCIAPDYSPSSVHADLFVPVKPGSDAALGLSVAHVLVEEGFVDRDFVCEQTDLPLLVRDDTHLIRDLARRLGKAKAASMVSSSNMGKYYHGNLIERTQALVFALTGNYGKKGSGYVAFPWLDHDGLEGFVREMFSMRDMMNPTALKMIAHDTGCDIVASGRMTSGALFWYIHGGLIEASDKLQEWDPYLKRPSERWGQEVVAIVELREANSAASERELLDECARRIARYKLPKSFLFRDEIVRSPSGKADYRWAKEQVLRS